MHLYLSNLYIRESKYKYVLIIMDRKSPMTPYHRRRYRTGPDPTNFWESNMDPPNTVLQSINSLQLGHYHLFNPSDASAPYDEDIAKLKLVLKLHGCDLS